MTIRWDGYFGPVTRCLDTDTFCSFTGTRESALILSQDCILASELDAQGRDIYYDKDKKETISAWGIGDLVISWKLFWDMEFRRQHWNQNSYVLVEEDSAVIQWTEMTNCSAGLTIHEAKIS